MGQFAPVERALTSLNETVETIKSLERQTLEFAKNYFEVCKELPDGKEVPYKELLQSCISMERDLILYEEAVRETMAELKGKDVSNYESVLKAKLAEKERRSHPDRYEQHPVFVELEEEIAAKRESSDDGGRLIVDEDIQMTDVMQTKCPYTGREMVNPVQNKHCKHTYDRDGIIDYIRQKGRRAKCPVGGCPNSLPLVEGDLIENREVRRFIERTKRTAQQGH